MELNQRKVDRNRRMAQALMGARAPQAQYTGRFYVAPNPAEYLATGFQNVMGAHMNKRADEAQTRLDDEKRAELARIMARLEGVQHGPRIDTNPATQAALTAFGRMPIPIQEQVVANTAARRLSPPTEPIRLRSGEKLVDPKTYKMLAVGTVPDGEGGSRGPKLGTYNPRDYTVNSWSDFLESNDPGHLKRYETFSTLKDDTGTYIVDRSTGDRDRISTPEELGEGRGTQDVEAERVRFQEELPSILEQAQTTLRYVDELEQHPGFSSAVGMSLVPDFLPATDKQGFIAREDQLKSGAFLEGVSALQGLGALSDAEGKKAGDAISRMNRSTKESEYRAALEDYREIIRIGVRKAHRKAGMQPPSEWSGGATPENRTSTGIQWSVEE